VSTPALHTARLGKQAASALSSRWNEFCRLRTAVLKKCDTDSIHDLRVASRRMRATLGLFAPFISAKSVKTLTKTFRQVTRELGRVRNIDEAILYFDALPDAIPALAKGLRRARKREIGAVVKLLKQLPCRDMAKLLRKAATDLAGRRSNEKIEAYLSDTSIQRYQALYDLLAPATIPENRDVRHGLRIAIKKWRYLLETVGQVCGQEYAATLEVLKEYQSVLGNLNDMVEFAALSDRQELPPAEKKAVKAALARDTAGYLESFVRLAATRPPQYIFHL